MCSHRGQTGSNVFLCPPIQEKRDKVGLLAEVLKLRISNQHLREESFSAVAQLHKISNILNTTPEGVE